MEMTYQVMNSTALQTDPIPQSGRISTTLEWLSTTHHAAVLAENASNSAGALNTRVILLSIIGSLFLLALIGVFAIICLQCHETRRHVGLKIGQPKQRAIEVGAISPPSGSRTTDASSPSIQNSPSSQDSAYSPTAPGSPSLEVRRHTRVPLNMQISGSHDTTQISSQNTAIECVSTASPYASAQYGREYTSEAARVNHSMLRNDTVMKRVMARDILDELRFDGEVFGSPSEGRCTVTEIEGVDESADTTFRHERPHIVDESTLEIVVIGDDELGDVATPQTPTELTPEAAMQRSPRYAVV